MFIDEEALKKLLCKGVWALPNKCPGYDTKQPDGEVPVMLELWQMRSTPSLPSLTGPIRPGVVLTDRALPMGQIELNCVLMLNWIVKIELFLSVKLNCLKLNNFWLRKCTYTKLNYLN